ncbi:DUF6881 domain-containing protein [Nocardia seriolae]|uniref:DUF6881 domain-containing protein n=1 Tax=Nocardia seriolae TaxID=37332 RepID=UPI000ABAA099|nr:hypothetical protein [Nocardia seriolae]QOW32317.1 hypothetical protein IMZ23_30695 [Nocardia seriolae]QUN19926.1 hypothetical protein KEC46_11770 [Nocardia seriolae]WNJ59406.1 hypothetical protein RMO66_00645 [Nocardia seriolae]
MSDLLRQQELVGKVVEYLRDNAPSNWTEIVATITAAGVTFGVDVAIDTPDGRLYDMGGPVVMPREVVELRKLMYTPGLGTWFTLQLQVSKAGDVAVQFDYDRPTPKPLLWLDFAGDLKMYPRTDVPSWLRDEIERQELEDISDDVDAWGQDGISIEPEPPLIEGALDSMDRETARQRAAEFVPEEPGCLYLEIVNACPEDMTPDVIFCELWPNRFERRRIEVYSEGRIGLADEYRSEGCRLFDLEDRTLLDEDPVPSIAELSREPEMSVREISPTEFQVEWLTAGGW